MATCKRCDKEGHETRTCKVPFRKAWPGRPAMKLLLRYPDGSYIETQGWLPPEMVPEVQALQLKAYKHKA